MMSLPTLPPPIPPPPLRLCYEMKDAVYFEWVNIILPSIPSSSLYYPSPILFPPPPHSILTSILSSPLYYPFVGIIFSLTN